MENLAFIGKEALSVNTSKNPRFVVLSFPYEGTACYQKGSSKAPKAIIQASSQLELYDKETNISPCEWGIQTAPIWFPDISSNDPVKIVEAYTSFFDKQFNPKYQLPILLGGEHTATLALMPILSKIYPDVGIIFIDAHADLRDSYESSKYSHACTARRLSESFNLVEFGVRSLSKDEANFIDEYKIPVIFASEWNNPNMINLNILKILDNFPKNVHITLDVDVFDSGSLPCTGTPEPFGLTFNDVLRLIKDIFLIKNVVGIDVVELCPLAQLKACDYALVKLIYHIMGYSILYNMQGRI